MLPFFADKNGTTDRKNYDIIFITASQLFEVWLLTVGKTTRTALTVPNMGVGQQLNGRAGVGG